MTCPQSGNWFRKGKEVQAKRLQDNEKSIQDDYDGNSNDLYYCEFHIEVDGSELNDKKKYYFYVKGKVCENCFELDSFVVGLAIVVDVLGTAFVMMVIYKYTKKKYSAGLSQVSKAPARSAGHAPPNPDTYEQLNPRTRAQEPYGVLNRMG
ncbi:T-cell surface glycoprotein CD3 epsilon chain isoform X2 [Etheostoma spectabile]|nr:T-cell surface glycoprotein CD3 epsilon chain isoform X2 [Etheostoma spectabile]